MTEDYDMCIDIATKLRKKNINVELNVENQKINKKVKYADKLNIKYVIIIGEDEIKNNVITLKNMETGEQITTNLDEVIDILK